MCPEKKVDWFDKNSDWHPEDRLEVRKIVHKRWAESYGASLSTETMAHRDMDGQPKVSQRVSALI